MKFFSKLLLSITSLSLVSLAPVQVFAQEDKIEIEFWFANGGKVEEANQAIVENFNNSQDEIHVTATFQGNYDEQFTKTQQAFAANDQPEIFVIDTPYLEVANENGMLEPIQPLIERDSEEVNFEDFIEGVLGNSYIEDELMGLPYFKSTPILYVNKTLLDKTDFTLEDLGSWEGLSGAIRAIDNGDDINGITMHLYDWIFQSFLEQGNGTVMNEDRTEYTVNSQAGVEAMDFMRELVEEEVWKIPAGGETGSSTFSDFSAGVSGFAFSSTADLTNYLEAAQEGGFELSAVMLPEKEKHSVDGGGCQIVLASGLDEEHKEAAWKFIKFATSAEQNFVNLEITGYLPIRHSTVELNEYKQLIEDQPLYKVAYEQLEFAGPAPQHPTIQEAHTIWLEEMERMFNDLENISTQDALDRTVERANLLLN
ncbi:ABC transporter substrate-binding protein [Facklamia sp. DSM 111018]|uniref:ABC transporter substrate-binding protein n=1 Tax=Facklamia lactis TaxID=2749967 RepID=A0ABS0LPW1_9LACT|nr:ABC transporter substrate-binding protein [Facklamia lactis]MBG9986182.1 ABC transporter substrate-binding protein [Facklamia lactis]